MDTYQLRSRSIELPKYGRSICIKALDVTKALLGNATEEEIDRIAEPFLDIVIEAFEDDDLVLTKELPFDAYNVFELPSDEIDDSSIMEHYSKDNPSTKKYIDALKLQNFEPNKIQLAALIVFYVDFAKGIEEDCESNPLSKYDSITASVDPFILAIHDLHRAAVSIDTGAVFHKTKIAQLKGARKGGEAKAKRTEALKDVVLKEANNKHQGKTATKAAKAIHEKLAKTMVWLVDDEEKPLLKDPEQKFIEWIRAEKKKNKQ